MTFQQYEEMTNKQKDRFASLMINNDQLMIGIGIGLEVWVIWLSLYPVPHIAITPSLTDLV